MNASTYQRIANNRAASAKWRELNRDLPETNPRAYFLQLRALVKGGFSDSGALLTLGFHMDEGVGASKNRRVARRLYRLAWRAGESVAAVNMAIPLEQEHRFTIAELWYRRAIEMGSVYANLRLARLLLSVHRDLVQPVLLLRAVIDAGPGNTAVVHPDGTIEPCEDDDFLEAQRLLSELV